MQDPECSMAEGQGLGGSGVQGLSDGVWTEEIEDCPELEMFAAELTGPYMDGFLRFQPSGQVMPRCFARVEKEIAEFEVREGDVWVASFPKCGTTWTQEMVWNIMHGVDLEAARATSLDKRVPFLELSGLLEPQWAESTGDPGDTLQAVRELQGPRVIKTHLAVDMLPRQVMAKKAKVIYVTRNPRDAVVSFLNHWTVMAGYRGSLDTLLDAFLAGVAGYYSPFLEHVLAYWRLREEEHVLFLTYEELKADLAGSVARVAAFLGRTIREERLPDLLTHLSFDSMKANRTVNYEDYLEGVTKRTGIEGATFMRKGQVGDWRVRLTEQQVERMAAWEEAGLSGSGLHFRHQI